MGQVVSVINLCKWQPCTNENDYLSQTAVYAQGMQGFQDPIMIGTPFYTTHLLYTLLNKQIGKQEVIIYLNVI